MSSIAVVGGGVIGLSTAIRLAEAGHAVTLISGQRPSDTTSAVAAAYWSPVWVGDYDRRWASETLTVLQQMAGDPHTAITVKSAEEWLDADGAAQLDADVDQAFWWRHLPGVEWTRESLPQPRAVRIPERPEAVRFIQRVRFRTPVARMPDYLAYLLTRFQSHARSAVVWQWVDSLTELLERFDWVFNCTGWQARHLVADEQRSPHRMRLLAGHVVRVRGVDAMPLVSLHRGPFHELPTYLVPRSGNEDDLICGGTAIELDYLPPQREPVRTGDGDRAIFEQIYRRCVALEPRLADQPPLQSLIGIRPVRDEVRVQRDADHPRLIHHYGHGGAGLTLSWGSAAAAVRLLQNEE